MGTTLRKTLLAIYLAIAVLTLGLEIYVRAPQCAGTASCAVSYGKGVAWSIAWPQAGTCIGRVCPDRRPALPLPPARP